MTAIPQIEKTQFENNFGGWLGVVIIDPKGHDRGVSVEPGGKIWLSEAEQRLTANAPRNATDNPFIEQTHTRRDPETGELEEYQITPLTVCSDMRYVPADTRPIPATTPAPVALQHAQAAARGDEPVVVTEATAPALQRHEALSEAPATIKPNEPVAPPRAAAAAAAAQEEDETAVDETGAAVEPQGEPAEGTYAANEEVGTPVQASTEGTEVPTENAVEDEGGEPAPWNG